MRTRGYFTANGFYGLIDGHYTLFASESDYYEMLQDQESVPEEGD